MTFVNSQLRQRQENERLKTIIARIESYDPVVSSNFSMNYKLTRVRLDVLWDDYT